MPAQEYVHQSLNQEVTAVGGHYLLAKEVRMPFKGQYVLYVVGVASFDTTCCGTGGCAYALVLGIVLKWKGETNRDGLPVSQVRPIHDEKVRNHLRQMIMGQERVHQVQFQ